MENPIEIDDLGVALFFGNPHMVFTKFSILMPEVSIDPGYMFFMFTTTNSI